MGSIIGVYSRCIVDDEVDIVIIFEMVEQFDDILVVQAVHDLDLGSDLLDHAAQLQSLLLHLLDCVDDLRFLMSLLRD